MSAMRMIRLEQMRKPVDGCADQQLITISFPDDMVEAIQTRADADETSFSEQVRQLVERGIKSAENA